MEYTDTKERLTQLKYEYHPIIEAVIVSDRYGYFPPVPYQFWLLHVEYPYQHFFRFKGVSKQAVIDKFLKPRADYYICNN